MAKDNPDEDALFVGGLDSSRPGDNALEDGLSLGKDISAIGGLPYIDDAEGNRSSEEKSGLGGPSICRRYARSRRRSSRSCLALSRARRSSSAMNRILILFL